jgi:putative flippase GtrA
MREEFLSPQFRRFLVTGGIAAGVNLSSRLAFSRVAPVWVAVVLAYLCGMATAYVLARRYVFTENQSRVVDSSLRFALVNLLGIAQTTVVSVVLGDHVFPAFGWIRHAHDIAHPIGVAAPVFVSFIAHRRWTFGRRHEASV